MAGGPSIRYKKDEMPERLQERFKKACDDCGFSQSAALKTMMRGFTEHIEKHGCPTSIRIGVDDAIRERPTFIPNIMLNETPPAYGTRKKKPKKKK